MEDNRSDEELEQESRKRRCKSIMDAFEGISTHDAVNMIQIGLAMKELAEGTDLDKIAGYIRHGAEMHSTLKGLNDLKSYEGVRILLAKLEGKG